jgi:hypothetical protein
MAEVEWNDDEPQPKPQMDVVQRLRRVVVLKRELAYHEKILKEDDSVGEIRELLEAVPTPEKKKRKYTGKIQRGEPERRLKAFFRGAPDKTFTFAELKALVDLKEGTISSTLAKMNGTFVERTGDGWRLLQNPPTTFAEDPKF